MGKTYVIADLHLGDRLVRVCVDSQIRQSMTRPSPSRGDSGSVTTMWSGYSGPATDAGTPFIPPAAPALSRCQTSSHLYSAEHGEQAVAPPIGTLDQYVRSGFSLLEYTRRQAPAMVTDPRTGMVLWNGASPAQLGRSAGSCGLSLLIQGVRRYREPPLALHPRSLASVPMAIASVTSDTPV